MISRTRYVRRPFYQLDGKLRNRLRRCFTLNGTGEGHGEMHDWLDIVSPTPYAVLVYRNRRLLGWSAVAPESKQYVEARIGVFISAKDRSAGYGSHAVTELLAYVKERRPYLSRVRFDPHACFIRRLLIANDFLPLSIGP